MDTPLIQTVDLVKYFNTKRGPLHAVDHVNLSIKKGETLGVVGESGCGKSTLGRTILRLLEPTSGSVLYNGDDIVKYSPQKMKEMRKKMQIIFQDPFTSLNPRMSVSEIIAEPMITTKTYTNAAERLDRVYQLMETVGLAERFINSYPHELDGGRRQRIGIARALSVRPEFIVCDEPVSALDVSIQAQILNLMMDLQDSMGLTYMFVTHNLSVIKHISDNIAVMYLGQCVELAPTEELFAHPEHPYTRALLRAIPRLDDDRDRILIPIEGLPPNPALRPEYCPFYDRCEYHMDKCREQKKPELKELEKDHFCACHLTEAEKVMKKAEIDGKPVKKAQRAVIGDEICLDVKDVRKYFPIYKGMMRKHIGDVKAIEDISFKVRKGETLGIVGESGCGKTTLARCIMRVYQPDTGEIDFAGTDIAKFNDKQMYPYRKKMAMIFQDPFSSLDPRQTAESIVGESLLIHKLVKTREEYEQRVDELLRMVDLDPSMKNRVPHEFSGGQRQRIGIARALSSNPDLIICDEPISALDVSIQAQIINLLEELQAKLGLTYLFIAHDLAVVKHISDRILVMYLGRIVEIAECEELYNNTLHPYTKVLLGGTCCGSKGRKDQGAGRNPG